MNSILIALLTVKLSRQCAVGTLNLLT